jgi:hypothetical protein
MPFTVQEAKDQCEEFIYRVNCIEPSLAKPCMGGLLELKVASLTTASHDVDPHSTASQAPRVEFSL